MRRTRSSKTTRRPLGKDPAAVAFLDRMGCPAEVVRQFSDLKVGLGVAERLHATGLGWSSVHRLLLTVGVRSSADVAALVTLANQGLTEEQIAGWSNMGSLDAGMRLYLKNVPFGVVRGFPLSSEFGVGAFLKMLQSIKDTGIAVEDVLLWHTAGVLSLEEPHLVQDEWVKWRSAAAHALGMRPAALAAAAGLSVDEAVNQWVAGEFDTETLKMMAALRAGSL